FVERGQISKINNKITNINKITEEQLDECINKIDITSASGVDAFTPQMMHEMWKYRSLIPELKENLIYLFNIIVNGRIPLNFFATFYACKLIPVIKKQINNKILDIRPICVPT